MFNVNCGGFFIDNSTLKVVGDTLTIGTKESVSNAEYSKICGTLRIDSDEFKSVKDVYTLKGDTKTVFDTVMVDCGRLFDAEYFSMVNGELVLSGALAFTITFKVNVEGATIVVTDGDSETVEPQADGSYRLLNGEDYSYSVSKVGYTTKTGIISVDEDEEIEVTLTQSE